MVRSWPYQWHLLVLLKIQQKLRGNIAMAVHHRSQLPECAICPAVCFKWRGLGPWMKTRKLQLRVSTCNKKKGDASSPKVCGEKPVVIEMLMFSTMCQHETNTVNAWQPSTHNNHPFRNVTYNGINKTSQNIFRPETVERQESFSSWHAHGHFEKCAHCYKKVPNVADNLRGSLDMRKATLRCILKKRFSNYVKSSRKQHVMSCRKELGSSTSRWRTDKPKKGPPNVLPAY